MRKATFLISPCLLFGFVLGGHAEILDRTGGYKIGQRMTLHPYVSTSLTYDSNVRSSHSGEEGDCLWTITPGFNLAYKAESWSMLMAAYYNYHQYFKTSEYDQHSYGQDLRWNWANATGSGKGWSLVIGESFQQQSAVDDLTVDDGRSYDTSSRQFQLSGGVQYRYSEPLHSDINGSYYWLDYMNDTRYSGAMYGWQRWTGGAEVGYAPSQWTDVILSGSYQGYSQDNTSGSDSVSSDSTGMTLQGGLGSYMTQRISYRLLAGWSRFEYGGGASTDDGFCYTASGSWKIGETWNTMFLATSFYQPSERQYTTSSRVDHFSWGLAKVLIRGKLRATWDLRYRHETQDYAGSSSENMDYVLDIVTGRLGFSYELNRFLSFFTYGEYQFSANDECERRDGAYDYDRWRLSCGVRLKY